MIAASDLLLSYWRAQHTNQFDIKLILEILIGFINLKIHNVEISIYFKTARIFPVFGLQRVECYTREHGLWRV